MRTPRPAGERLWFLAGLIVVIVLIAVFTPTLAQAVLGAPLYWAIGLVLMGVLFWKLCRDLRVPLAIVALLLGGFQCLFVKISQRVVTEISPAFGTLCSPACINRYRAGVRPDGG